MCSSESLYNAVSQDDIDLLTTASIVDYGFHNIQENNWHNLFGAYQSISKFITKQKFITTLHNAYLNENLHEKVEELTNLIPNNFRNHWKKFIANDGKINPIYI